MLKSDIPIKIKTMPRLSSVIEKIPRSRLSQQLIKRTCLATKFFNKNSRLKNINYSISVIATAGCCSKEFQLLNWAKKLDS